MTRLLPRCREPLPRGEDEHLEDLGLAAALFALGAVVAAGIALLGFGGMMLRGACSP